MKTEEKVDLLDQMVIKCNDAVKMLIQGQYIGFCSLMVEIIRMLAAMRNIIVAEANPEVDNDERNKRNA